MRSDARSYRPPLNTRALSALVTFYMLIQDLMQARSNLKLVELFDRVVERVGIQEYLLTQPDGQERWENILELRIVAAQFGDLEPSEGLSVFLEAVSLVADVDALRENEGGITLITLHQSKGLEFPIVFIVGMEEGILPHFRSFDDPAQMEEERRLCYVGVTRAKRRLYLLRAFRRSLMGGTTVNEPSRFLEAVPKNHIAPPKSKERPISQSPTMIKGTERLTVERAYSYAQAPVQPAPTAPQVTYKTGDRVRHAHFGEGVIVSSVAVKNDYEVTVVFQGLGIKKLLISFARLEKI